MTTLPLPPFLTLVLGILLATALVYGALSLMRRDPEAPMWEGFGTGWVAIIVILGLVWLGLFGLTLAAVFSGTWKAIVDPTVTTLGLGGLTAALLGAPFLIWGTVLKHQTVRWQKEGHMTDRISKAVEQLGAEKTVDRIGRPVTIWTGEVRKVLHLVPDRSKFELEARSTITNEYWDARVLDEHGEIFEGLHFDVSSWASERTVVQWQAMELKLEGTEVIGATGDWRVFSETVPNLEVRIGAILSLERIAQDSTAHDKGRDHVRVMEILCAYIRNNAPAIDLEPRISTLVTDRPRSDIEVAMNVLRSRNSDQTLIESIMKFRLDLSGSNLSGVNLSKASLAGANLSKCRIQRTNFQSSDLRGVNMHGSLIYSPSFIGADLRGLTLTDANVAALDLVGFRGAKHLAVFIDGAVLPALYFSKFDADCFFGANDTKISERFEEARNLAAQIKILRLLPATTLQGPAEDEIAEICSKHDPSNVEMAKLFEHWNPHSTFDLTASDFRRPFIDKHGLRGWPYDDT